MAGGVSMSCLTCPHYFQINSNVETWYPQHYTGGAGFCTNPEITKKIDPVPVTIDKQPIPTTWRLVGFCCWRCQYNGKINE
jgi:hypothetical protein